jgi:alkylated DNA repair dioxygenase AlkB
VRKAANWSKGGKEDFAAPVPTCVLEICQAAIEMAVKECPKCFDYKGWQLKAEKWGPDDVTTIVNYYPRQKWAALSPHKDTHEGSLTATPAAFYPVVSLSVGDAAFFNIFPNYVNQTNPGEATKVKLRSGDVLLFGGQDRLVVHSVDAPLGERPKNLKMVEGRLNVTLRHL